MSFWNSENNSVVEDTSQLIQDYSRKSYTKIDPIGKLHVIHALDNGQSKADIAREYGVHPQTIAYIYKQKESIIKKYTQKYNLLKEVRCINLDQTLLDWMEIQIKGGNIVREEHLREKAQEVINTLSGDFNCIDDWLLDFRIRHSITKYLPDIECSIQAKEEWLRFISGLDVTELYLGGTCALLHSLDLDTYVNGQETDNYVSLMFIVNCTGSDKRELIVVGREEVLDPESSTRSLPVNYFCSDSPQVNYAAIVTYLNKWDNDLKSKGKSVLLAMNIPDDVGKVRFENIKLINSATMDFVTKIIEKIVDCFKYHYRKLQITKKVAYGKDSCQMTLLDYIHMMSSAWYNVSSRYIHRLFFPPVEGCLYFNIKDDNDGNYSLSRWCRMYNIPINLELYSNLLDKYIFCDKQLPSLNLGQLDIDFQNVNEILLQNETTQSTSGIEAYQAMKRLISYLQSECARGTVMKSARFLENHMEYGALLEMHEIIASTNDSE